MLNFIKSETPKEGIVALSGKIATELQSGKKVLWLIAGGSNISIAKEVMDMVRRDVGLRRELTPNLLDNLTISQTDERFGPVGHVDSNWQQMIVAGFDFSGLKILPVLRNLSLEETIVAWSLEIKQAFNEADIVIAQFGMGADGHIAGLLPHSPALIEPNPNKKVPVASHQDVKFTRVSLTPEMFPRINAAYMFVFDGKVASGPSNSKKTAMQNLRDKNLSIEEEPAQLLKMVNEATVFTDCLK